jgi:hypothetical protein
MIGTETTPEIRQLNLPTNSKAEFKLVFVGEPDAEGQYEIVVFHHPTGQYYKNGWLAFRLVSGNVVTKLRIVLNRSAEARVRDVQSRAENDFNLWHRPEDYLRLQLTERLLNGEWVYFKTAWRQYKRLVNLTTDDPTDYEYYHALRTITVMWHSLVHCFEQ